MDKLNNSKNMPKQKEISGEYTIGKKNRLIYIQPDDKLYNYIKTKHNKKKRIYCLDMDGYLKQNCTKENID